MACRFNCCHPENDHCAREQLRPVPNPEQSSSLVTHMAIADPVAFRQPEPYLSEHRTPRRERKGEEQSHRDSGSPSLLIRRIATPIHRDDDGDNENVQQHERQTFGYVDKRAVAPERIGHLLNWNAMFSSDLIEQGSHAPISCRRVCLARNVVGCPQAVMSIRVAYR